MKRSVLKHLKKRTKLMTAGPSSGSDFTVYDNIVFANGSADSLLLKNCEDLTAGKLAYIRAKNHLALAGALPKTMSIGIVVGGHGGEGILRNEMNLLSSLAKDEDITILGGTSRYLGDGKDYLVNISMTGHFKDVTFVQDKKIKAGMKLIMAGVTAMLGTSLLKNEFYEELRGRFSESYIETMGYPFDTVDISKMAEIARDKAVAMHDISNGGVYAAVYQITDTANLGITLNHDMIPIDQPTIELCEYFGINPYQLLATGGLLIAVDKENEEALLDAYNEAGIIARTIGVFTKEKERLVISDKFYMRRVLTPNSFDDIEMKLC